MANNVQYRADLLAQPEPAQPFPESEFQETSVDIVAVAKIFREHYRIILGTGLAFLLVVTVLAFAMRNRYTATATFIPPGASTSGASALAGQLAQLSGLGGLLGTKSSADLYVGLLRSRTLNDRMIDRFHFMSVYKDKTLSQTEAQFAGHTDVNVNPRDSIVSVTFTDHDPNRARDVANAYLQELQQASQNLALTESSERRLFFEQRLKQEKDALADAEVALKQSQEKTGLIAPAGQTAAELQAISQLREQVATRRVRLASLLHDETEQNPDVLRVRSEIGNLEAQISQLLKGKSMDSTGAISTAQVPSLELDYIRLSREVKYHDSLYEIIARQYEAARLDEAHETTLQLLDPAVTPEGPSGPPRFSYMFTAFLLGVFISSLYVGFRFYFLPRLYAGSAG